MTIKSITRNSEIFGKMIELSCNGMHDIESYLSSIEINDDFPNNLVTLIQVIKIGESSYGEYDEYCIKSIHNALDRNPNFKIIGTGGFCICLSNKELDICYKINLMSLSYDVGLEYATVIHNSDYNPLVPTVHDVHICEDTYCSVMEKLKPVSGSFEQWYNEKSLGHSIKNYNVNELAEHTSKYSNANSDDCDKFLIIIKSVINSCKTLGIELDIDVMSFNLMMRDKQLVFIDPLFPTLGYFKKKP